MKLDARMTMFVTLVGVFLTCLIVGNLIGGKLTEVHLGRTWIISVGEIPFPLTFILTDLINEFYGRKTARRVTLLGFSMIGLTVLIIQLANAAPFSPASAVTPASFANVFSSALTIQIASMIAFVTAQYVDIGVFFLVKKATGDRLLWLRATGSTAVSQMIDTVVIISLAFGCRFGGDFPFVHRSAMPFDTLTTIILTSYVVKVTVAVLVTPIIYALHGLIERVWHLHPLPADVASGDL